LNGLGCVRCLVKAVQGKEVGRDATEGGVRADPVIVVRAPVFDEESGFGEGAKPMLVEAVIAEGTIEALDEGVLHRFPRLDMMESNAGALRPEVEGFASELGAIVHGDDFGKPTRERQALENGNDRGPVDGSVDMDGQALASKVIDERKATTGGQLVVDKVHRPAFIGSSGHGEWHAGHRRQFPAALAPHRESPSSR
jgi:hypothetical protein